MKILLIGFSKQSASVLNTLISEAHPTHECVSIDRDFNHLLRLSLPNSVNNEHPDAQVLILNLDGVGMMTYMPNRIKQLQNFIRVRAVLFIAKTDLVLWRQANIIPKEFAFFLKSPHTKYEIMQALEAVMETVPNLENRAHHFAPVLDANNIIKETINPYKTSFTQDADRISDFLRQLTEKYFNIKSGTILYDLISISFYNTPIKITAGRQTFYVNKAQNLALIQNVDRLLDYLSIARSYTTLTNVINIQPILYEDFDEVLKHNNTYQRLSLNTLLWQFYDKILPEDITISDKNLLLKIKYMPNFSLMTKVSHHTHSLVSSCLVKPRTVDELQTSLELLGEAEAKGKLNKLMLLSILSGVADLDVLKSSTTNNNNPKAIVKQNEGVTKANSTGFFKRLLQKLLK